MENMPVFVKIGHYTQSMNLLQKSKERLDQAKDLIEKLEGLRAQEAEEISVLQDELAHIEKRLEALDSMLKAPQKV